MRTTFLFEWKNLIRTPLNIFILLFFLGTGLYSIYYGTQITKNQLIVIDNLERAYASQINSSFEKFKADTTTKQGRIDFANVSEPSSVNYLIKPIAICYPNAFSVLAVGQRDVLPFYKQISTEKSFTQAYDADISNPEILVIGNFDLSFVIINLLPLLMIALSYNVLSQEKEQGTFSLLALQSSNPQRVIFYKLLFRILLLSAFTYALNFIAICVASNIIPVNLSDTLSWLLIVTCYLFFWFAVCYLLISFQKSSTITAFYMAGCWLLFIIVIPSLLNFYINISHPIGIRADMASEQRKIEEDVWSIKPKILIENFYRYHPEYKTGNLGDTLQYSPRRFVAYYDELERRLSPIAKDYSDKIKVRNSLMNRLSDFVLTLKAQKMLNQTGESDLQSFINYDQSTLLFHEKWQAFIYRFIFNDLALQPEDYRSFPKYTSGIIAHKYKEIIVGSIQLIIVAFLLITARNYIVNNFKNQ